MSPPTKDITASCLRRWREQRDFADRGLVFKAGSCRLVQAVRLAQAAMTGRFISVCYLDMVRDNASYLDTVAITR